VNSWGHLDLTMPFGGFKQSGIGRENGTAAADMHKEAKSAMVTL
jgi:acyl-CoA reductase-like NAD-dependent aldehyde dehydrogenase